MLNLFINSSIYGQAIGATFDFSAEAIGKPLTQRRLTPSEFSGICRPVYERKVDMAKITALYSTNQIDKVNKINRGMYSENIRVNSLYVLARELNNIIKLCESNDKYKNEMIIAYIPPQLLRELQTGRYKFYANGTSETTYYSEQELAMWIDINDAICTLYSRLVFSNIENCKENISNTAAQADRVKLYNTMVTIIKDAYNALKNERAKAATAKANNNSDIDFDIFSDVQNHQELNIG